MAGTEDVNPQSRAWRAQLSRLARAGARPACFAVVLVAGVAAVRLVVWAALGGPAAWPTDPGSAEWHAFWVLPPVLIDLLLLSGGIGFVLFGLRGDTSGAYLIVLGGLAMLVVGAIVAVWIPSSWASTEIPHFGP